MIYVIVSIMIAIIGQILLKIGIDKIGKLEISLAKLFPLIIKIFFNPFIIIGLMFYAVGAFTWILALSKVPISLAYPLLSISYVIIVGVSSIFFHEHVSLMRWIGVGIIILGVTLIAQK
ncbi:MAG: EamA family transporter [bacterium]